LDQLDDRDVVRYLKYFTFSFERKSTGWRRNTPRTLARASSPGIGQSMTDLVHGEAATKEAVRASEILFGGELDGISESTFNEIVWRSAFKGGHEDSTRRRRFAGIELLVHSAFARAKGRRERTSKAAAST